MLDIQARLDEMDNAGLRRRMRVVGGPQGPRVMLDGRPVLLLCSNNYLGLADHPRVRAAAAEAAMRLGTSAGASRLISGNMAVHGRLERRLADFKGTEAALLFGSGYLANCGTVAALAGAGGVVFSDELNHASIIDGCRLARAETFVYRHADVEHLAWGMRKAGDRASLIATDGVFSMDGDLAPLVELHELAREHDARLLVDEAHGTGTIGPGGRGSVAAAGLAGEAYVCGSAKLVEFLLNSARPFIFSTALPPPVIAAASVALDLLISRPKQIERLAANATALREGLAAEGLQLGGSETQIVPVIVGGAIDAMALCELALEHGVFAQAIRPPTVPEGTCRLRATAMATHRVAELRKAARVIGGAARELGITTSTATSSASTRTSSSSSTAASSSSSTRTSSASPAGVRGRDASRGDAEDSVGDSLDQAA
jgi:8-amino-7-oxononanoate synthase